VAVVVRARPWVQQVPARSKGSIDDVRSRESTSYRMVFDIRPLYCIWSINIR
jgi:hypothetical protein